MWNRGIHALAGYQVHKLVVDRDDDSNSDDILEAEKILQSITLLPVTTESSEEDLEIVKTEVVEFVSKLNRELNIPPSLIVAKI